MTKTMASQARQAKCWYIRYEPLFGVVCVMLFVVYLLARRACGW